MAIPEPQQVKDELEAMRTAHGALAGLAPESRARALTWLVETFAEIDAPVGAQ